LVERKKFYDIFTVLVRVHEYSIADGRRDGHQPTASTGLAHSVAR